MSGSYNPLVWVGLMSPSQPAVTTQPATSQPLVGLSGVVPPKPDAKDQKIIPVPPSSTSTKYNNMTEVLSDLVSNQASMKNASTHLRNVIDEVKCDESTPSSSPRRAFTLFDQLKDEKAAHKAIPFTETAIEEMIQNTFKATQKQFDEIAAITNQANLRTVKRLEKNELIKLCELNQSIAFEYLGLLNRIQFTIAAWRAPEAFATNFLAYFKASFLANAATELIDSLLFGHVAKAMNVLDDDVRKVKREIGRADEWLKIYKTHSAAEDIELLRLTSSSPKL